MSKWYDKIFPVKQKRKTSFLRQFLAGSFFKVSDIKNEDSYSDIKTLIEIMRSLAKDSQVATALSYYATDATTQNSSGDIIWASADESGKKDPPEIINSLFKRWNVNNYARDHILELATVGNLYIPTTDLYRFDSDLSSAEKVAIDNNTIKNQEFDIIPSYKIPPEDVLHLWKEGKPEGFIYQPSDKPRNSRTRVIRYPESSIIHFSLGGLLGDYSIEATNSNGDVIDYDIQFASPLLESAVSPTQILNLLEDASILSSLIKVVRFINVDCGNAEEEEIRDTLQQIKDAIEQQLSINTNTGDAQSFLNPQSPNNLIYVPKINGNNAIDVVDLNMKDDGEATDKLLEYYQDKKLSVLGVPKEALNFSSSEGLGGAGAVMSQRSALYANSLQRLENAYMNGWRDAINKYFLSRNMSGFVDKYTLHMNPIITTMSTVQSEKRDAVLNQATSLVDLFKSLKIDSKKDYRIALSEILSESFPETASAIASMKIDVDNDNQEEF